MINFPFGTNGKSIILGVPILKHVTVFCLYNMDQVSNPEPLWPSCLNWMSFILTRGTDDMIARPVNVCC